jgi:hypothetical protein
MLNQSRDRIMKNKILLSGITIALLGCVSATTQEQLLTQSGERLPDLYPIISTDLLESNIDNFIKKCWRTTLIKSGSGTVSGGSYAANKEYLKDRTNFWVKQYAGGKEMNFLYISISKSNEKNKVTLSTVIHKSAVLHIEDEMEALSKGQEPSCPVF